MQEKRQEVMAIMSRINRKMFTASSNNDDSFIGFGQINILKEIINHEKITQDKLAAILNLDKTTVAKAVKRLEINALITRNRSETDLRKKELVATKKALVMKERMKKYLEDNNNAFFEDISGDELSIFKDVLEKIEGNIERKRNMMNDKKQLGIKIVKLIEKNKGLTATKVAELLGKELEEIKEIIEKLIMKEFVEENGGILNITKKVKENKKENKMRDKEEKRKGAHEEYKEIFKVIMKNSGLSKDEFVREIGKSVDETDALLKKLESKGLVEIKDGKLYANKDALKEKHKN